VLLRRRIKRVADALAARGRLTSSEVDARIGGGKQQPKRR